MVKWKFL